MTRKSRAGEYGKTHRVDRKKQVTTVNPEEPDDTPPADAKKSVTLPEVSWAKRPLPKDDEK